MLVKPRTGIESVGGDKFVIKYKTLYSSKTDI